MLRRYVPEYCKGCREDFYNNKNTLGIKECWLLKKAEVVWGTMIYKWTAGVEHRAQKPNCWKGKDHVFRADPPKKKEGG